MIDRTIEINHKSMANCALNKPRIDRNTLSTVQRCSVENQKGAITTDFVQR